MLKKFIQDIAKYSLSQLLPALTAFITTPILTRLFAPAEYGDWALTLSVSSFLVALAASGFGSAVIRFYPAHKANSTLNTFFTTIAVTTSAVVFLLAVVSYLMIEIVKSHLPAAIIRYLPLIIFIFIAQSLFTIFLSIIRAQARSGLFTLFQLLMIYGSLVLGLLLVIGFDFRIDGLLWGTILTIALTLPVLIIVTIKGVSIQLKHFCFPDAMQIIAYAWPLALGSVAMWGLRLSDLFIIGLSWSEREIGLYSVSYNISAKSIELLVGLFLLSVSPLLMNTWENEGQMAAEKTLTMVTRVYLILCIPATVGLSILAFPIVALLTSPEYYEGYKIFWLVASSSFVWGLANIAQMGMAIKKRTLHLGANQIFAAILHIVLALFLVPRFGYAVAAVTTLVGYTTLLILHSLASRHHLIWRFPFRTLRNVLIASFIMGATSFGIYQLSGNASTGSPGFLLLSVIVSIPAYFTFLWLLKEANENERNSVIRVFKKVMGKEG